MSSTDADAPVEAEAPEVEVDEVRQQVLGILTDALGDAIVGSHIEGQDLWVRVPADAWRQAAEACRDRLDCDYFCFLSGLDWMPNQAPNPEAEVQDAEPGDDEALAQAAVPEPAAGGGPTGGSTAGWTTGVAGGETRFQVFARLYSTTKHWGVTLKADVDDDDPAVDTISTVYRGADWHERETWEMYGIRFTGHPDLRHLYLPGEFEGFPLRKDFPLLAREVKPWPGLVDVEPMPGEGPGGAGEGDGEEAEG